MKSVTLIPKPNKDSTKKDYTPTWLLNTDAKPSKILASWIQKSIKGYYINQMEFTPEIQGWFHFQT